MRALIVFFLLLVSTPAHAARCWVTLVKMPNTHRAALGPMHGKLKAMTPGWEGASETLALVVVDDDDVEGLKEVAARFHGQESRDPNTGARVIPAGLRKKLVDEAVRLGADPIWDPEKRDVEGE